MGMTFVNKMPAPIHADGRATYQSSSTGEIGSKQPCTGASTKRFLDSTLMSLLRVAPSANKAVSRCTVPSVSDGFSVTDSRLSTTILKAVSYHVIEFAKSRQYGNTANLYSLMYRIAFQIFEAFALRTPTAATP